MVRKILIYIYIRALFIPTYCVLCNCVVSVPINKQSMCTSHCGGNGRINFLGFNLGLIGLITS